MGAINVQETPGVAEVSIPQGGSEPARPVDPPPDPFEFLGNRVVEEERHGPPMGHQWATILTFS